MSYEQFSIDLYRARIQELEDALKLAHLKIETVAVTMGMWKDHSDLAASTFKYLSEALEMLNIKGDK